MIKYFRFTEEKVLWGLSWANLAMYAESIPRADGGKDDKGDKQENKEDEEMLSGAELFGKLKRKK